jgi:hypothetical protein
MQKIAAIIIGHSHLSSVIKHLMDRPGEGGSDTAPIEYYVFDTFRLGADFLFSIEKDGGFILNPVLAEIIERRIPPESRRIYLSMFGGNAHNALTLLEHPRPFDVILAENPGLPRIEGAELTPESYIKAFIAQQAAIYLLNMTTLKKAHDEPVFHIESPPPIGDNDFVQSHLEQYFRDQQAEPRVAPALLRYKLWRIHSSVVKMSCDANGIEFLPAPTEAMTPDGFLLPEGYGDDSTHAGPWYGGSILRQLEARLGAHYGGWDWLY